jgi:hypothetical protein
MAWHRQHTHWWRAEERAFHHTLFYDSHVERLEYQDFFKRIGMP